jgi:hypothetical protein
MIIDLKKPSPRLKAFRPDCRPTYRTFGGLPILLGSTLADLGLSQNASNYDLDTTEVVPVKRFGIVGEED